MRTKVQGSTLLCSAHALVCLKLCLCLVSSAAVADGQCCRVLQTGKQFQLQSPLFVYRLDASDGLRALSWKNRLSGHEITLGKGPELEVDLGEPSAPKTVKLDVAKLPSAGAAERIEARFGLTAKEQGIVVTVIYRWDAKEPVLHKFVEITNAGNKKIRLLNVRLGTYPTDAKLVDREQGFPVYLNDEYFMSLAHPAGWAVAKDGTISLRQYPGTKVAPGATFKCMEAVYGVGDKQAARETFVVHVRNRMRRVVRGHDKPYAIYDNFGSWPQGAGGNWGNSDEYELHSLRLLAESQRATGCRFDFCNIHFWVDSAGDMKGWDPLRFPKGIKNVKAMLDPLGTAPGLWICSSVTWGASWSLNADRAKASLTDDPSWFCRASEPIKSMFREAFVHHVRNDNVRELKFDSFHNVCNNPHHDHLPGLYSTEAIENSVIEFLHDLDKECPDVFLILYWGYRSPWWLLHGDTLFDSGIGIEAASPSSQPAPYARDSVTQKLDQAQRHSCDVPALGKDSLGVWLSSWAWNSCIGKERWQEGFVMDIARGSLMAQIWADNNWLSPPEWQQLDDFIALLRAQPSCFGNPRFILGNPMNDEPYGYCCTDGRRAFLAIDNCTWQDRSLPLELNSAWGLPDGQRWDLYRWYPQPARLKGDAESFGPKTAMMLRPFEVVLLEVVLAGQQPSLDRSFTVRRLPIAFAERSRAVEVNVRDGNEKEDLSIWTVLAPVRAVSAGGATLTKQADGSILASGKNPSRDTYTVTADTDLKEITGIRLELIADPRLPSQGPGRAYNGNFALSEFSVTAVPQGNPRAAPQTIALRQPAASFSQSSFGGWPIEAAIDGDPKTAWSIDPREGETQTAVFEAEKTAEPPQRAALTFQLRQGYLSGPPDHTIGRFRLLVTGTKKPIPPPAARGEQRFLVRTSSPSSSRGGIFVISAELKKGSEPAYFGDIGTHFSATAKRAGQSLVCQPVLGKSTYPSCWQAWRIALEPAAVSQAIDLLVSVSLPANVMCSFQGHFIPNQ
jgi:hypothetical protein